MSAEVVAAIGSSILQLFGAQKKRKAENAIADMQEAIADRRMKLGEELFAQAKLTWEKETQFAAEVFAAPLATPDYAEVGIMQTEAARTANLALRAADADGACNGYPMSASDDAYLKRALAQIHTDLTGHTMRMVEARAVVLNDRRYARRMSVIALGKGRILQTAKFSDLALEARGAVRSALGKTISSGLELWGYSTTRMQTPTPYDTNGRLVPRSVVNGVPNLSDGRYDRKTQDLNIQVNLNRDDENGLGADVNSLRTPDENDYGGGI